MWREKQEVHADHGGLQVMLKHNYLFPTFGDTCSMAPLIFLVTNLTAKKLFNI